MLSCKESSRLLSQALERKLTGRERLALRIHLLFCDMCKTFARQLQHIQQAVRGWQHTQEADLSVSLPQTARERITQKITEARTKLK